MSNFLKYKVITVCLFALSMQSCEKHSQQASQSTDLYRRDSMAMCLGEILNERNFERALPFIDSLHIAFPNDPQFYFVEGWIHDLQGDSLCASAAYAKSMEIYDSLIAESPNLNDMINKAIIVQILFGMEAYEHTLDEMLSIVTSPQDTLEIEQLWRRFVFKKDEVSFGTIK